MAGHSRLEQIRASMRGDALPAGGAAAAAPATPATNQQPRHRKTRFAIAFVGHGSEFATQVDRRLGARWCSAASTPPPSSSDVVAAKAQRRSRSAGQAAAQAPVGAAARAVLHVSSCVFWVAVTALLASWSTPVWALLIPAPIAVGAAFLATLLFLRYRWLRGEPLPPQRSRPARRLPPWGSAARQPMAALAASERGLFSLLGVMERGRHAARRRAS